MAVSYASYTYRHPNLIVRFPHLRRLRLLAGVIGQRPPRRWLDYGAGDGEVYRHYAEHRGAVSAVLYEPAAEIFDQAVDNVGMGPPHALVRDLGEIEGQFDLITAFEVLEHLPLPERIRFYQFAAAHLAPGGRIILEVPVEIGPILLLKEWGRSALKGRVSEYSRKELLAAAFLGKVEDSFDRYNPRDERTMIHLHHGFDIRRFVREIERIGRVIAVRNSPLGVLPSWLNQCQIMEFRLDCRDPARIAELVTPGEEDAVKKG